MPLDGPAAGVEARLIAISARSASRNRNTRRGVFVGATGRPGSSPAAAVAWRDAIGAEPLERLRDLLLAAVDAEHQDLDYRAVTVGDLDVFSTDGCLTQVPDTPANRDAFGSAGTADDSSRYPQVREVRFSNASTRAIVAVTSGPSGAAAGCGREKGEVEQVLLDKALDKYPQIFTDRRIWVLDRNFPGIPVTPSRPASASRSASISDPAPPSPPSAPTRDSNTLGRLPMATAMMPD